MKILLFGNSGGDGFCECVERALQLQCNDLVVDLSFSKCKDGDLPDHNTLSERALVLVYAKAGQTWSQETEDWLAEVVESRRIVLPVLDTPVDANGLPRSINQLNAFVRSHFMTHSKRRSHSSDADVLGLVDDVLGLAWLRRHVRRVFISYRRSDSHAVARQLFYRFSRLGYEVFLDDASIPHAVNFQRELKWWLNDADLLIALLSPNFELSKWCVEEISFAQRQAIGILGVKWPKKFDNPTINIVDSFLMADQIVQLKLLHFKSRRGRRNGGEELAKSELTDEAWEQLLAACNKKRTRSVRARLDNLIKLTPAVLESSGPPQQHELGDFIFQDVSRGIRFVRVLPFRPRPEHLHEACQKGQHLGYAEAGCLYAENDLSDPRVKAMRWLTDTAGAISGSLTQPRLWPYCGGEELL